MNQHRIRRLGWSVFLLICAAFGGSVLWRLTLAQQTFTPRVAERVSPPAPQSQQKNEQDRYEDLGAINADPGGNKPAGTSELDPKATHASSRQLQEEILIVGDPMRLVLPHSWLEKPLVVRARPGSPVTFEALDSGKFGNGKIKITVKADAFGLAAAPFYVGNEGGYRVLATSPEHAGEAEFVITSVKRQFREDLESGLHAKQYLAKERAVRAQRQREAAALEERTRLKEFDKR